MCAATLGVTTSALGDLEHYSTWDNVHNAWIGRQYFRTLDSIKPRHDHHIFHLLTLHIATGSWHSWPAQ